MAKLDWEKANRRQTVSRSTQRTPKRAPTCKARYAGVCVICQQGYDIGTKLAMHHAGWGHKACVVKVAQYQALPTDPAARREAIQQYRKLARAPRGRGNS